MADDYNQQIIEDFRANGGKVGGPFVGMELLLLTTKGAKSGQPRTKPLAYTKDGDKYVVIASKGGADTHPSWYYNVLANPEVEVELGTEKFRAKAEVTGPAERERLYTQHANQYPGFWDYKKKTSRDIPVILLERVK